LVLYWQANATAGMAAARRLQAEVRRLRTANAVLQRAVGQESANISADNRTERYWQSIAAEESDSLQLSEEEIQRIQAENVRLQSLASSERASVHYWHANATAEEESLQSVEEENRLVRVESFQEGVRADNASIQYWMANSSQEAQLLRIAHTETSSANTAMQYWKANSTAEAALAWQARSNASSEASALQHAEANIAQQTRPLSGLPAVGNPQLRQELHQEKRELSHMHWIIAVAIVACLCLDAWRRRKGGHSYLDKPLLEEALLFPGDGLFKSSALCGSDKHETAEYVLSAGIAGLMPRGEPPKAVHVKSTDRGSWAESSGMSADDEIVAVNDILVKDMDAEYFHNEMQRRPLKLRVCHKQCSPERAPRRRESFRGVGRFEPSCSVFDYTRQPGQVLRCLHVEAPGRGAAPEGQRSLRSEVTIEGAAGTCATDVHMRLIKVSDIPVGATAVKPHGISESTNGAAASGTWEKSFRFEGIWQLLEGADRELDAHGVLQLHLVRMSPPPPVVLQTGREPSAQLHCSIASSLAPSPAASPPLSPRQADRAPAVRHG